MKALAAILAAVLALSACSRGPAEPGSPAAVETRDPWRTYEQGWSELPPPPEIHNGASLVWAGRELLYWGGEPEVASDREPATPAGFAFDPVTRKWRLLPEAPGPARYGPDGVWTGTEVLFFGGAKPGALEGVAFDPATETWRVISGLPDVHDAAAYVWTGSRLIAWGGGERGKDSARTGAAYDPETDRWTRIADSPIGLNAASAVWTGKLVLVFGSLLDNGNHAATRTSVGAIYEPEEDRWQEMPPSQLSPQATSAGWVGNRLVAWDYEVQSQAFDPNAREWSKPVKMPLDASECYPGSVVLGDTMFAWFCGQAAEYSAGYGRWQAVHGGLMEEEIRANDSMYKLYRFASIAPAGEVVAMAAEGITVNARGVPCYGCPGSPHSFWVYRPTA